jgi:hypothetical protein
MLRQAPEALVEFPQRWQELRIGKHLCSFHGPVTVNLSFQLTHDRRDDGWVAALSEAEDRFAAHLRIFIAEARTQCCAQSRRIGFELPRKRKGRPIAHVPVDILRQFDERIDNARRVVGHKGEHRSVSQLGGLVIDEWEHRVDGTRAGSVPQCDQRRLNDLLVRVIHRDQQRLDGLIEEGPIRPPQLTEHVGAGRALVRFVALNQSESRAKLLRAAAVVHCGERL